MILELENKERSRGEVQGGVDVQKYHELVHMIEQKEGETQALQEDFKNRGNNQEVINHYEAALEEGNRQNQQLSAYIE